MSSQPADHIAPYRQSPRVAPTVRARVPGSGWAWFLGVLLALLANFGLHQLAMSWWFSYYTGVLPGHDSAAGWWSLGGTALRWCVALAIWLTAGTGLSHLTRRVGDADPAPVAVRCFRRSAPSLKLALGLLATIVGAVLYAALDAGENPVVDTACDEIVITAFWIITAVVGALAVIYVTDSVRVELHRDRAMLRTRTGTYRVLELRALDVERFVVRTHAFSETYFLAGWFPKRASQAVGAYAVEAACSADEDAAPAAPREPIAAPLQANRDGAIELVGAAWPWWIGAAAGVGIASLCLTAALGPQQGASWRGPTVAFALLAAWVLAVSIACGMPATRVRRLDDARPIRFRLLLAEARREQHLPTILWVRTMAAGVVVTGVLLALAYGLLLVIGVGAILVLAPLMLVYLAFTHPGIWFLLVNAVRLVRDGRTLKVDATGAWLDGRRVTACESVGGAVVVYTGLEPTWLRVASMSRDAVRWRQDAEAIASYVQARMTAAPDAATV